MNRPEGAGQGDGPGTLWEFFWSGAFNAMHLLSLGPVVAIALVLNVLGYVSASPGMRGLYGHVLLAAAILAPFGVIDLLVPLRLPELPGLRIGNVGPRPSSMPPGTVS